MADWADEKAKRLLDDPWGAPVAGDIVDGVAQALREARAEGMETAAKVVEIRFSSWREYGDVGQRAASAIREQIKYDGRDGSK